jgi:hypothetical protein
MSKFSRIAPILTLLIFLGLPLGGAEKTESEKWLDVFKTARNQHSKEFSKARKAGQKLDALRENWLQALILEDVRASKELTKKDSKVKLAAQKQLTKVRLERLKLLFEFERDEEATKWAQFTLSKAATKQGTRVLQVIHARRKDPSKLPALYQQILREGGGLPSMADKNFQLPPSTHKATLLWFWLPKHPLSRLNIEEFARIVRSFKGQLIAFALSEQVKPKISAVKGVIEGHLSPKAADFRSKLCMGASPLLIFFDSQGKVQLVDPTAKDLDRWFRNSAKKTKPQ